MTDISIGQVVRLNDNGIEGTVKFFGETAFAPGLWVGVELTSADGKNDGSVQNRRYFECEMGKGMFLRSAALTVISQPQPSRPKKNIRKAARPSSVSSTLGRRPSSVSDFGSAKRLNKSISSPSPNLSRRNISQTSNFLGSPSKSPSKQQADTISINSALKTSSNSSARAQSASSLKTRHSLISPNDSMPPPSKTGFHTSKSSLVGSGNRLSALSSKPVNNKPLVTPRAPRISQSTFTGNSISKNPPKTIVTQDNADETVNQSEKSGNISPFANKPSLSRNLSSIDKVQGTSTNMSQSPPPVVQRSASLNAAATRSIEDFKTKIRIMEKKAIENREKLKTLEKAQEERDKFECILKKLQNKYQLQQQESLGLRKQLKETEEKLEQAENSQVDNDLVIEMATLDREVAEETAEALKTELNAMKLKNEELELEVDILKQENAELGEEMSPEEKASQGWLQMERNNERLREALICLRDMTQQTEAELRDEIKSLRDDLKEFKTVKERYEVTKEKLNLANVAIEDLKQQLDNAMGAEDMIEELTEKNVGLQEKVDEFKAIIADYETLKEISDEVEINHVEIEKEMQSDIDSKESIILEQKRRATQQEKVISDMEYTLFRFRELVTNLQNDLDDIRASHAMTEAEAEELSNRSRAILDLNRKLHISATKTQVEAIDLELRGLDSQEALEHLKIIQLFLPESFNEDRNSVLALLRFKRVGFKALLLHRFFKEKITTQPLSGQEENIFAACDALNSLTWVAVTCDRFTNAISRSTISEFLKYEGTLFELEPVERTLNGWIDSLRRNELNESQCAMELQRSIALMSHLAEVYITSNLEGYADKVYTKSVLMQSQLENLAISMSFIKQMVEVIVSDEGGENEQALNFSSKSDLIISQTRNAKVIVSKTVRELDELNSRSLSLTPDTLSSFENCETITEELAKFSRHIGDTLYQTLHVEGRSEPYTYNEVETISRQCTMDIFGQGESEFFTGYLNKVRTLTSFLLDLSTLASNLEITQEFEVPLAPWILRSQELKLSKVIPVNAENEIRRLKEENHERARMIALKDQIQEENMIKIELLESRMRDARMKNKQLAELESCIEGAKKREIELTSLIKSQNEELSVLEADREKWKKIAENVKSLGVGDQDILLDQEQAIATAREMDYLLNEINDLQAAVRYLSKENFKARFTDCEYKNWLEQPLIKPPTPESQRLDLILSEGRQVFLELLDLSTKAQIYDFSETQNSRLSWRSVKLTPQYHFAKQREQYETWKSWKDDLTQRAHIVKQFKTIKTPQQKLDFPGKKIAEVNLFLPEWKDKMVRPENVTVLEPCDFENFKEALGFE
ncbi:putative cap-gly domain-containing protein [Erysiphe necator]|uniref:Putative cap-gly domain-containing protein n=1 Tax=Uncinula necator TaxID=52586 RepID=A0A0B1P908_UNCNE|nr:putative cap-gly domain-containing protein [Erysiphe necator]